MMTPFDTSLTVHPWWVHTAENALNWPAVGWVTTTFWSAKIVPPPSGMSAVVASGPEPPPPPDVSVAVESLPGALRVLLPLAQG